MDEKIGKLKQMNLIPKSIINPKYNNNKKYIRKAVEICRNL